MPNTLCLKDLNLVVKNGYPVSVIIPVSKFAKLLELIEDIEDSAELRRIRKGILKFRKLEDVLSDTNNV